MDGDGMHANIQHAGDLFVRTAGDDVLQYFQLSRGEATALAVRIFEFRVNQAFAGR